jgi:thiol-disulfide isomerase/thioredoxin
MKAKNSLMGLLWPLIKIDSWRRNRLFSSGKAKKPANNIAIPDLEAVAAESQRIADKLLETRELVERSRVESRSHGGMPLPLKADEKKDDKLRCGWREDEEDRWTAPDQLFSSYRQNPYCHENPAKLRAIMKALFLADHDAAQLEQYELENRLPSAAVPPPVSPFRQLVNRGFGLMLTVILIMGAGAGQVKGQEFSPLMIGGQMPDLTLQNLVNYPAASAKISDFKGKLLILYSWSTTCRASVELLAQMAKLQAAFPGKLQIIAVGKEDLPTVKKIAADKKLTGLTFAPPDPRLLQLFPHELVPQLGWIGPDGKLLGVTTEYDATEGTIGKILNGQPYSFKDPKADQVDFDSDKPLFLNGNGKGDDYLYRSVLLKYSNGLPGGMGIKKDSSALRIYAINQGRLPLYFMALQLPGYNWPHNRILYEAVDPTKFCIRNPVEDKWEKSYCYELSLPLFFEDRARAIMLQDLQRLFGVTGRVEKRMTACYVLKALPWKLKLGTKGGPAGNNFHEAGSGERWMRNSTLYELTAHLQEKEGSLPVVDETAYLGKADLKLAANLDDLAALNNALARYGLVLERTERLLDMLVFTAIDTPAPTGNK